jgi:hypothetical protein
MFIRFGSNKGNATRVHAFTLRVANTRKDRGVIMHPTLKKIGMAALAATTLAGATLAGTSSAEARWSHRGGWVGPAVVGGLALGAFAAATAPRYGYGPYGYYGGDYYGCPRQVVGYNPWGRPIVRRVCY